MESANHLLKAGDIVYLADVEGRSKYLCGDGFTSKIVGVTSNPQYFRACLFRVCPQLACEYLYIKILSRNVLV